MIDTAKRNFFTYYLLNLINYIKLKELNIIKKSIFLHPFH